MNVRHCEERPLPQPLSTWRGGEVPSSMKRREVKAPSPVERAGGEVVSYLLFCLLFILSSCLREEENLFPESAALRLNHAIENTKKTLISPKHNNGWIMEYFPTNNQEGYTFLMKFDNNSFATIAAKNKYTPVYTTDKGAFDVIGDNGPVLTFNTYNKVFHLFSDPKDPLGSSSLNGIGLGGDYEFVIMDVTNDLITLKGKKRGTHVLMRPVKQGQDWQGYFDLLDKMDVSLFNLKLPVTFTLKNKHGDDPYYLTNGSTHIFTAKTQSQIDAKEQGENIPFIITDYGLRFAQPFIIGTDTVQAFRLGDDKSKLVCMDENVHAEITGEELSSLFLNSYSALWAFELSALSDRVASIYNRIVNSCISVYQAESVTVGIGYSGTRRTHELRLVFVRNAGRQTLTGNLSMTATASGSPNGISFQATGTGDNNGNTFSNTIDGFKEMAGLLSKSFVLSSDILLNPVNMKFMQAGGTEVWFQTACQ